jgi:hypothetical protein
VDLHHKEQWLRQVAMPPRKKQKGCQEVFVLAERFADLEIVDEEEVWKHWGGQWWLWWNGEWWRQEVRRHWYQVWECHEYTEWVQH